MGNNSIAKKLAVKYDKEHIDDVIDDFHDELFSNKINSKPDINNFMQKYGLDESKFSEYFTNRHYSHFKSTTDNERLTKERNRYNVSEYIYDKAHATISAIFIVGGVCLADQAFNNSVANALSILPSTKLGLYVSDKLISKFPQKELSEIVGSFEYNKKIKDELYEDLGLIKKDNPNEEYINVNDRSKVYKVVFEPLAKVSKLAAHALSDFYSKI
ncbi:TPA: hypothetical protein HA235_07415 [Candidatus Woesearchaeota archaeon]|nr:hypothetical protein [Candidatus Woesearchaeota archaeon]HIH32506.1 hypothetical protein [Candidatus Woesearchaeota archaeon]HIH55196.1 hypothetical protein [Candidatus Woesearchaeota archaeon]HIJ01499.1 hypothetical protein [Candidatus Woesearchaeota archaeon]HIJ13481.1 hypothetical protein [Candidatus Woesearchaeota archaeon]